jgi:hypothetical protein
LAVFAHSRLQPLSDQAENALVGHSVLDKLHRPFVAHLIEEAANVRVHDPVHPLPLNAHTERV